LVARENSVPNARIYYHVWRATAATKFQYARETMINNSTEYRNARQLRSVHSIIDNAFSVGFTVGRVRDRFLADIYYRIRSYRFLIKPMGKSLKANNYFIYLFKFFFRIVFLTIVRAPVDRGST
jgi:hypothetical protein